MALSRPKRTSSVRLKGLLASCNLSTKVTLHLQYLQR